MSIITYLDSGENSEKLLRGPTCPRPGPMLLNVDAAAEKCVIKSNLSRLMIRNDMVKSRI